MKTTVTGRHIEMTPALKAYAEERVNHLARYSNLATEASVILTVEKYRHQAEIAVNVNGQVVQAKEETSEMYASIDRAVDKIQRQLKKYKDRLHNHRTRSEPVAEETPAAERSLPPMVHEQPMLKTLTPEAAAVDVVYGGHPVVVFRHPAHARVNVAYRKPDGTVGWIDPQA